MFVDSHCHLDFPDLAADRAGVLARARAAGVVRMVTISTHVARAETYRAIAEQHADVFFTVGTHPHYAGEERGVGVEDLLRLSRHPKCVGIGESGLDYHYDRSPRDAQIEGFRIHIAAARESGLPLVIHARSADEDMIRILEDEMGKGPFNAVLHCFSSGPALARAGLDMGFSLSMSGIITFKASEDLRAIAATTPLDRLLIETDAPYLAPVPHRGRRNEPAFVVECAKSLAAVHDLPLETIARQTTANAKRLFARMSAGALAA